MKIKKSTTGVLLALFLFTNIMCANGQSPSADAKGTVNGKNISVKYSSPAVRGRVIFGGLIPYDKVWRAGANRATEFKTDKNITVEGKPLAAGTYSIYAIPGKTTWQIIFNSETGQWGTNSEGVTTRVPAKDVLTVTVKPTKTAALVENLKYNVTAKGLELVWENVSVPVAIK